MPSRHSPSPPCLSGCGDDSPGGDNDTGNARTDHNDADVAFASDMIQHHAQALAMVDLTVGRDLDPEVEALAEAIRAAQGPEIETMTDWLTEWDEPIPATVRDHVNARGPRRARNRRPWTAATTPAWTCPG